MTSRADAAAALHGNGANCAQCVLCAFAGALGMDAETALRVATGFGGGMGRSGGTCGALTGAFMVIGLARGMRRAEDAEAKDAAYTLVREASRRFQEKNGAVACRDLLGIDLGTAEGLAAARARNLFATRCNGYIKDAVSILESLLKGDEHA